MVCAATIPILLGCGFFRFWILQKEDTRVKAAYASSANYACEATSAVRTIASLTRERDVWQTYHDQLIVQGKRNFRSVAKSSILYAASESLTLFVTALAFWYGGRLIGQREYDILTFFIVFAAIVFSAQSAGTAFSFSPDISKAVQAAGQLKKLFDRVPDIDVWSSKGKVLENVEGSLEFKDVYFRYRMSEDMWKSYVWCKLIALHSYSSGTTCTSRIIYSSKARTASSPSWCKWMWQKHRGSSHREVLRS